MKPKVYIDGQAGTTGLEILQRLSKRDDIDLIMIDDEKRKDKEARKACMNAADLVFLCLPDQAAVEAVELIDNPNTKVIDASTAHRCSLHWAYGFSELGEDFLEKIKTGKRVANPGCHATGFISIAYPLRQLGIFHADDVITSFSLTGYSGGGKKMIAQYEQGNDDALLAPQLYGLGLMHKHLPEMKKICGLKQDPLFCPIVDDYYRGMATSIMLKADAREIYEALHAFYGEGLVSVHPFDHEGNISANTMAKRYDLVLIVRGRKEQTIVTALFDNLGKGACGAAIQNMNIMLGLDPLTGLVCKGGIDG